MTSEPAPADGNEPESRRWDRQYLVAILLLSGFAILVAAMLWLADGSDSVWQRRVYVFGAAQAIVFTAIGWLFGREVGRTSSEAARANADEARKAADQARTEAQEQADAALAFKVHVVQITAKYQGTGTRPGPARDTGATGSSITAIDLNAFLTELFDKK